MHKQCTGTMPKLSASAKCRQKLLLLCSSGSGPESELVAWSLYDGSGAYDFNASDLCESDEPPFASVLAAMQSGWRVVQSPQMKTGTCDEDYQLGALPYEWMLELWEQSDD